MAAGVRYIAGLVLMRSVMSFGSSARRIIEDDRRVVDDEERGEERDRGTWKSSQSNVSRHTANFFGDCFSAFLVEYL